MKRLSSVALTVLVSTLCVVGAASGCYDATEIRVELTTTAPCTNGMETQLFTGARGTTDFGTASAAGTQTCAPDLGTLSIVPSGARDDQFDMEVVAGVGVPVSDCRPESLGLVDPNKKLDPAKGCIVVRRRASFRPHQSLRIPIVLSDRCIGVPCETDKTCDLGVCTPTVDCTESGCPRERGDIPIADGGTDAVADATVDATVDAHDSGSTCELTPTVVAENQAVAGQLFMQGADLVYGNFAAGGGPEIRRMVARGGPPKPARSVPGLLTLTANDAELDFMRLQPTLTITREPVGGMPMTTGFGNDTSAAIGISGGKLVAVLNLGPGGPVEGYHAFAFDGVPAYGAPTLAGSMLEVVVDEDGDWYGVAGGASLHHFKPGSPDLGGSIAGRQPGPDIGVANRTIFVAMGGAAGGIYMIPRDKLTDAFADPPIVAGVLPRSITARKSFLYYVEGTNLWRVDITTLKPPVLVTKVASDATSLTADEGCVYWIDSGGQRIMRHRAY